ncbi:Trans-enoyl reductase RAP2 [Paramyrothecium foliicola]|nr:Trans-enoyl reductase RAP2 [Paramyrothecium foliicola]
MSSATPLPTSRLAVVQDAGGKPTIVEIPVPSLKPGTVLVECLAVALNPTDYKMRKAFPKEGAIIGNDFAGIIAAVAEGTDTDLVPGDMVGGISWGSQPAAPEDGAFASFVLAPAPLLFRLDPVAGIRTEEGASFGTALATCALAFWDSTALGLVGTPERPVDSPLSVLVYGGSTATGTIAIQLSGFDPIAVCSPRNFDLVRSYGATAVFDYSDPDVSMAIKDHTGGKLKYALDCISDNQSVETCYGALARFGGRYASLEHVPDELLAKRRAVNPTFVLAFEIMGEGVTLSGNYGRPADKSKLDLCVHVFPMYQRLLKQRKLRTHPLQELNGGWKGVVEGLSLLEKGELSGTKIVVKVG